MEIEGKIAMVTGSAQGLGKAFAEELLRKGAKVIVADVDLDLGEATVAEFQKQYGEESSVFAHADVTSQESMENVFETRVKEMGGLDILINNAGVASGTTDQIYAVNAFGVMRCSKLGVKCMKQENGGRGGVIVNIASVAAYQPLPISDDYCSSKAACLVYTRSLGQSLRASSEVRMRVLCPGYVLTDMTLSYKQGYDQGVSHIVESVDLAGGWTEKDLVVRACMGCIEKDLEQGAVIRALASGIVQVFPEQMPETPLFAKH